jgi:acyl-CoA thioesterase-1
VAFGDSLTQGVGSSSGGFVSLLSKNFGTEIVNGGVSGDTTAYALKRLPAYLGGGEGQPFDIAIVLLGGNDALRRVSVDETFSNLRVIIEQFQESGALVILVGIQGGVLGDKYKAPFDALAKEAGVVYVPDILEGIIGVPNLMSDTVHPNDKGYLIVAKRIAEKLDPILKAVSP